MSASMKSLLGPRIKDSTNLPRIPRSKDGINQKPKKTQENTESVANYLVDKFNSPEYKPLFLKVAWRLDRGTIDRLVATSFELGKNKRAYFISLVKKEPNYYG